MGLGDMQESLRRCKNAECALRDLKVVLSVSIN